MLPLISVVTITFNSEKTVEETIRSVVSQDYLNLEYIIIDGGSTDSTLRIVEKYRDKIALVISEPDKGISDAFNKGILKATGEIIGIINSDDILAEGALQTIAENYDPSIDVYSGNILIWNSESGKTIIERPDISFDTIKLQYNISHPARFIRRDAYQKYGLYRLDLRYQMDVELLCRFYKKGAKFAHIDKVLAKFRLGGATANSIFKKKEDHRIVVQTCGGSERDFRRIWIKALCKNYCMRLFFAIFGEDIWFKLKAFKNKITAA